MYVCITIVWLVPHELYGAQGGLLYPRGWRARWSHRQREILMEG